MSASLRNPWVQLIVGVVCMACVANLQYGWTLFVDPIDAKYHWGRAAIQVAFTVFVAIETWLIPLEGYLVDRFGPRWVVIAGSLLVTAAWIVNSAASSLPVLYLGGALGGIGAASLRKSGTIVEVDHPRRGKYLTVGNPIKLSASPTDVTRSPLLGEHSDEVLAELGYAAADVAVLRAQKAI